MRLPLELSSTVVHTIRIKLDLESDQWTPLETFLNDDERHRAARFRFDEPRRRFIICRSTLRQILGASCHLPPETVPLTYNNHGKPSLVSIGHDHSLPKIEFSVSHSGDFGLISITLESRVGVDIEQHDDRVKFLKLAERFFAPAETAELHELPAHKQLAGFYHCWTGKEAYIKAMGSGLALPLNSFCVCTDPDQPSELKQVEGQPNEPVQWRTEGLTVAEGYSATVMVARPDCSFLQWNWHHRS